MTDLTTLYQQTAEWFSMNGVIDIAQEESRLYFKLDDEAKDSAPKTVKTTPSPQIAPVSKPQHGFIDNLKNKLEDIDNIIELNNFISSLSGFSLSDTATHAICNDIGENSQGEHSAVIIQTMPDRSEDMGNSPYTSPVSILAKKISTAAGFSNATGLYYSPWRTPGQRGFTDQEKGVNALIINKQLSLLKPHHIFTFGEASPKTLSEEVDFGPKSYGQHFKTIYYDKNNKHNSAVFPLFDAENLLNNSLLKQKCWGYILKWKELGVLN